VTTLRGIAGLAAIALLGGCGATLTTPGSIAPSASQATPTSSPAATPTLVPARTMSSMTADQTRTLSSLKRISTFPLYTMRYYGDPVPLTTSAGGGETASRRPWGCSLAAIMGDKNNLIYARNFDWDYSPGLLLFSDPSDAYASVSMVNLAVSGPPMSVLNHIVDSPLNTRGYLLNAPFLTYDGMNERGLTIAMAAVPAGNKLDSPSSDPNKKTILSPSLMREVLDHAGDVNEAVAIIRGYNVDWGESMGYPPVHYLIADGSGRSVLVEWYMGTMRVIPNQQPWQVATNYLVAPWQSPPADDRYDTINRRLAATNGRLDAAGAMDLLSGVARATQWSVVYQMSKGEISVAMGANYEYVYSFRMSDYF
jgi:hypothetical protein